MSTPLQFAKEQCANYADDGSCKGIGIRDDGSPFIFGKKPACVLANRTPCRYFEECVLPMGIELCNARNVQREKERQEAKDLYARFAPQFSKQKRKTCKACNKREVEPRHQLCPICAKERKNQRARAAMAKRRSSVTNLTSQTCDFPNKMEGVSGPEAPSVTERHTPS